MTKADIKHDIESILADTKLEWVNVESEGEDGYFSIYLGTVMFLDPCGAYQCCNPECVKFWDDFDDAIDDLGLWTETGEGDPCDLYLCCNERDKFSGKIITI